MTWNYQHIKNNDMEHISTNQRFYYFTSAEVISHQHLCFSHLECGAHSRRCWCEVELREYIFENPSSSTKPATPLTYNSCKKKKHHPVSDSLKLPPQSTTSATYIATSLFNHRLPQRFGLNEATKTPLYYYKYQQFRVLGGSLSPSLKLKAILLI